MTDLDTVTVIRPNVDLPTSAELAAARQQLSDAILEGDRCNPGRLGVGHLSSTAAPGRRRRRAMRLALAGGLAAAAGLVAIFLVSSASPTRLPQGKRPMIQLAAVQFLDKAAAAALQQPSSPPLPKQFVYSETEDPDGTLTEMWLSVDGSSSGLSRWTAGTGTPTPVQLAATISARRARSLRVKRPDAVHSSATTPIFRPIRTPCSPT